MSISGTSTANMIWYNTIWVELDWTELISSFLTSYHLISFNLISSHLIYPHPIYPNLISFTLILSDLISSHRISSQRCVCLVYVGVYASTVGISRYRCGDRVQCETTTGTADTNQEQRRQVQTTHTCHSNTHSNTLTRTHLNTHLTCDWLDLIRETSKHLKLNWLWGSTVGVVLGEHQTNINYAPKQQ